jgi:ribosomal protein S18 acetylase RimI-like enzyme
VSRWWPWSSSSDETSPSPEQHDALIVIGVDPKWRDRIGQVDELLTEAMRQHGDSGYVPVDVLLNIRMALHPVVLRPAVPPVIPGRDG